MINRQENVTQITQQTKSLNLTYEILDLNKALGIRVL